MKKLVILVLAMVLMSVSVFAIDHPVEPFQKAKVIALTMGIKTDGGIYGFHIQGKGMLMYTPATEMIQIAVFDDPATKDHKVTFYREKQKDGSIVPIEKRYWVGRQIEGKKQATIVSWSVAYDTANDFLKELGY